MTQGPPSPRAAALERVRGPACWLVRVATATAALSVPPALVVWVRTAAPSVDDWPRGTLGALVVLAVVLAPAGWLLNVRLALTSLLDLPATLGGIARRRGSQLRDPRPAAPDGALAAARTVRQVVRDHRDVIGSWGLVAQLVSPGFWLLSVVALAVVPVLWLVAVVVLVATS